ncbi:hypothetical protein [Paenibacillus mesotrionivorans]|uniref:Uncharacterized protein n=1 Tax=Paenibacillus mesotrionivorans TaxID=3160968 RepID=A0ACC7NYE7_9BACL
MPKYTPNLNIQLADPATDGNQTFNIDTMINNPVEKLDEALGLVPVSGDVRAATTGNIVLSGAQTIDGIALSAGNRVLVKNQTAGKENGIYTVATGPWTRAVDANSTAKLAAGISVYVEEGAANGKTQWKMTNTGAVTLDTTAITFEKTGGAASATDAVIGSRTVSDTTAPTGDTGTVTTLFGWLANMVKAITGGATWRTLPGMSIAAIKTVLDAATNLGTPSTLMKRDASGRAQVAAPSAAGDIARKDTVDAHASRTDNPHAVTADQVGAVRKLGGWWDAALKYGAGESLNLKKPTEATAGGDIGFRGVYTNNDGKAVVQLYTLGGNEKGVYIRLDNADDWSSTEILTDKRLMTRTDVTYYVRTDGYDSNSGTVNTAAGAFKTIGKAISMIPQVVNHTVTINVGPGAYDEDVILDGYTGKNAVINLLGDTIVSTSRTIKSLTISNCVVAVIARGFNITTTTSNQSIAVVRAQYAGLSYMSIVQSASNKHGIYAVSAVCYINNSTISNKLVAIVAEQGSRVTASNNAGSGNTAVFSSASGSIVAKANGMPTGTALEQVVTGGITLQENGVINPWGDNTAGSRPYALVCLLASQTIAPATWVKVNYVREIYDQLNNYDHTTNRFIALQTGFYHVSASALLLGMAAGVGAYLSIWINGEQYLTSFAQNTVQQDLQLHINKPILLLAGQYMEIYVIQYSSVDVGLFHDTTKTNLFIHREG